MWIDPVTAAHDRMYRYRRLFPMTEEQYLDETVDTVEWALRIADLRGDRPWEKERRRDDARLA